MVGPRSTYPIMLNKELVQARDGKIRFSKVDSDIPKRSRDILPTVIDTHFTSIRGDFFYVYFVYSENP